MKTETSGKLFQRAQRALPSGYTRQMAVTDPYPIYVRDGKGCWITDVDGNRFIDWINNFSAQIHGHAHPEILRVINEQAGRVQSTTMPSEWEIKLAELLVDRLAGVDKVRFTNSGTEANIIAIKAARAFTGRPKVAKMEGGYHGQYDLLEASYQPTPDKWGPIERPNPVAYQPGTPQSLLDETVILPLNNIEAARALIREHADQLSCVILDPWRLQIGMVEPRVDFIEMLREETDRAGIVLIFDEVWALRFGYHGYQGQIGITPDLTTMGKIIGGGQPVGAIGGLDKFMSVFALNNGVPQVKHSGTFTANPMSMAAGYTTMSLMTEAEFDRLNGLSERLREGLERLRRKHKLPGGVAGGGSVSTLILSDAPIFDYRSMIAAMMGGLLATFNRMQLHLMEEGVLTLRGGFVGSTVMTDDDVDFTIEAYDRALVRLTADAKIF